MNEQANEPMITMTMRVPVELVVTLKQISEQLGIGIHHTTLARQCLVALTSPSEFGDLVLNSVRAASVVNEGEHGDP
jgi:hypothetical protein